MTELRWWVLLAALSGCGTATSFSGDRRCETDADCAAPQRCFDVTSVLVGSGECFESSGTRVCRPVCADGVDALACGCQR